jgi:hypothetical protein
MAQYPPANDEQIVNVALVLLLNAATMHFVPNADWTFHRRAFQIGNKKSGKGFEARVDGFLRRLSDDKVMAILEVKPCVRGEKGCEYPDAGICQDGRVDQPLSRQLHYSRLQWKFHVCAHISFRRPPDADILGVSWCLKIGTKFS